MSDRAKQPSNNHSMPFLAIEEGLYSYCGTTAAVNARVITGVDFEQGLDLDQGRQTHDVRLRVDNSLGDARPLLNEWKDQGVITKIFAAHEQDGYLFVTVSTESLSALAERLNNGAEGRAVVLSIDDRILYV